MKQDTFFVRVLPLLLASSLWACAGEQAVSEGEISAAPPPRAPGRTFEMPSDLYGHLRMTQFSYDDVLATPEAMLERSSAVVAGTMVALEDGRKQGFPDDPRPMSTVVVHFDVDTVIKGEAGDRVYFEYFRAPFSTLETLREMMPNDRMVLFLTHAIEQPGAWRDQGKGLPEGAPLMALIRPMGMVIEEPIGVIHPLVQEDEWVLGDQPSLEAAIGTLQSLQTVAAP
ncbi:MAG: hypothetical protein OEZ06_20435 [Myxococcales bacterium]|nr:hypothetical protein [Myxococcales bacterium]